MKFRRTGFFKGLPGFSVSRDDLRLKAAESSIYGWWWRFLRLSPVFWYARTTGKKINEKETLNTSHLIGDLSGRHFESWWKSYGSVAFEEIYKPAETRIIDVDQISEHELYRRSVVIEVPLTSTRKKIIRELKSLLDDIGHDVNSINVIQTSTAKLKLKTKRYNLEAIKNEYWVLIYKILFPDIPLWKIGDRLQLSPSNRVRGRTRSDLSEDYQRGQGPFERLQSLTGRYLYKARFSRHYAQVGSFPNYSKFDATQYFPFGIAEHENYLQATSENSQIFSPWQEYVRKEYQHYLFLQIKYKNHLDDSQLNVSFSRGQFERFVQGQIDLTI